MGVLLIVYVAAGFAVSTYLLATMRAARPREWRWDMWLVSFPETWLFAVALWPLYLAVRLVRTHRGRVQTLGQRERGDLGTLPLAPHPPMGKEKRR